MRVGLDTRQATFPRYFARSEIGKSRKQVVTEMKVLIVDDNEQMRQMIQSLLREQVEEFYECSDGAEALDAFTRFCPDWVLMDLNMEDDDGLAATRRIIAACPGAKVMIVTNFDDVHLRNAAQDAGACGYVTKDNLFGLRQLLSRSLQEH